jgi:hypothetical protein
LPLVVVAGGCHWWLPLVVAADGCRWWLPQVVVAGIVQSNTCRLGPNYIRFSALSTVHKISFGIIE